MSDKPRLLMAVYNPIEVDGRVKRSADALADDFDVTLFCRSPYSAGDARYASDRYRIVRMEEPTGKGAKLRSHVRFWRRFVALARHMRPQVVYAHDFFLPFVGWLAARAAGARFVYDAHEIIVPTPNEPFGRRDELLYRLEQAVVARADLVVAANPERANAMTDHYGLRSVPVSVGNVPPTPRSSYTDVEIRKMYPALQRHSDSEVRLLYQGDVNLDRGILPFIDALDHLPSHFVLIIIGRGPHETQIAAMERGVTPENQPRLRYAGGVPHAHLFDMIRQCDVGLVTYSMQGLNNILCAPNKVFEYAHAGLPMVSTCQPPIARLFGAHRVGLLVGCNGDMSNAPKEIAEAAMRVARERADFARELPALLAEFTWERERARLVGAVRVASGSPAT